MVKKMMNEGIYLSNKNMQTLAQISQFKNTNADFRTIKKEVGEKNLKTFFKEFYPKYNITQIQNMIGVSDSTIEYWFNKLNISLKRNHIFNKSYAGNENKVEIEEKNGILYKKNTIKITPELAYLIGFTLGDGAVQKFMIECFNKDEGMKPYIYNAMKIHGAVTEDKTSSGLWRLRLSSVLISNLIKEDKKPRNDTIEYILKNENLAEKFVAGFWDAEGSVLKQKNYYHIYLYNSNKDLIEKIKQYLESIGIESTIIVIDKRGPKNFNGRIFISKKVIYRLGIRKKSFSKWANQIGLHLLHSKKSVTVKNILQNTGGN